MNIFDSTKPMRRMLGELSYAFSETTYRNSRSRVRKFPALYALFCWGLILSILLLMISGCGRYKEELEGAKQQIEKLNSDVKRLTEESTRLKQETNRLSEESKTLSDKNERMQRDLDDLSKAKGALSAENKELQKQNKAAEEEIASLKGQNASLLQEIEKLKKPAAEITPPPGSPTTVPTEVGPQGAKQPEGLSPCDEVLAFMKASERIVRQQKGTERTKLLEQVRQEYVPKMKGAPEKAIKAAEDWVKEGTKLWDHTARGSTFRLLELRNTVLETCGKSARDAGF